MNVGRMSCLVVAAAAALAACRTPGSAVSRLSDRIGGSTFRVTRFTHVRKCEGRPDATIGPDRTGATLEFTDELADETKGLAAGFRGRFTSGPLGGGNFDWRVVEEDAPGGGRRPVLELGGIPFDAFRCSRWEIAQFRPLQAGGPEVLQIVCRTSRGELGCEDTVEFRMERQ